MRPYYRKSGVTLYQGNALSILKALPDESVQMCVTSPPYWGLRDYGLPRTMWGDGWLGCLGLEPTPEMYVAHMTELFSEVRRVLKHDGTCWVNLGDCYSAKSTHAAGNKNDSKAGIHGHGGECARALRGKLRTFNDGLKPKDLVGMPWRVAFALQADGWYLRSDIIWHKPNPMPESVRDRPTKSHEYLFLLAKSQKYFYDAEAIKEAASLNTHDRTRKTRSIDGQKCLPTVARNGMRPPGVGPKGAAAGSGIRYNESFSAAVAQVLPYRNKRTVWSVPTRPFKGAHFATFPPKLVEPCILAGSRPGDVILDPFSGAGTTGLMALQHGREYLGIELNPEYCDMTIARLEGPKPKRVRARAA